jgi:hypothetical protein
MGADGTGSMILGSASRICGTKNRTKEGNRVV